jgi:hypothetical protein
MQKFHKTSHRIPKADRGMPAKTDSLQAASNLQLPPRRYPFEAENVTRLFEPNAQQTAQKLSRPAP